MSASTEIMVRDAVNPKALFDAARAAARSNGAWKLHYGREFLASGFTRADVTAVNLEVAAELSQATR